eukprot:8257995-Karenia_brevis.AAC.1
MLAINEPVMAVALIVGFTCYLRPGELEGLTLQQLVPPVKEAGSAYQLWSIIIGHSNQETPGKTGMWNE